MVRHASTVEKHCYKTTLLNLCLEHILQMYKMSKSTISVLAVDLKYLKRKDYLLEKRYEAKDCSETKPNQKKIQRRTENINQSIDLRHVSVRIDCSLIMTSHILQLKSLFRISYYQENT